MNTPEATKLATEDQTTTKTRLRGWLAKVLAGLFLVILVFILKDIYPLGIDWYGTYAKLPETWRDPYQLVAFTSPPWIMLLLPHAWLPVEWGNAINLVLNVTLILVVINRFGGGRLLMLLVFTSAPFFDLMRTNNIDWIPLLAILLPPIWGLPVLAAKPQALGGVAAIWWKRSEARLRMLIPLVVVVGVSFLVWGFWPAEIKPVNDKPWNFAPWPFMLPLGAYLLYRSYQKNDLFMAAAATPFLVPYIAPYSVTSLLAFSGSKYRREAFIVYIAFWVYFIAQSRV